MQINGVAQIFSIMVNILPVAGYAEKNEPHIFDKPRPNNCNEGKLHQKS